MGKLEQIEREYKKFQEWGYCSLESAQRAVKETYEGTTNVYPYVYQDSNRDESHVFELDGKRVLFFGLGIFERVVEKLEQDESHGEVLNGFRQWLIDKKKNINIYQYLIDEYLNK